MEIEGVSKLVIEMIKKFNNGKDWEKVAQSWRTAGLIQDLEKLINRIEYKIINHVIGTVIRQHISLLIGDAMNKGARLIVYG